MNERTTKLCTAFEGTRRIASGELEFVALQTKEVVDRGGSAPILIFDDFNSEPIELDFRGSAEDVARRLRKAARMNAPVSDAPSAEDEAQRGPGRPKLGVVAREVTLLPRHWDWLNRQPGGASVALRKLVEEARRANESKDRVRRAQEAAYRFTLAMAGNQPGFEEASRALFAGDRKGFERSMKLWPADIREYAKKLAEAALPA